ncbi:MAG: hypothetical protein EOO77_12705, partial [Oxalobacteraceae bacterium]
MATAASVTKVHRGKRVRSGRWLPRRSRQEWFVRLAVTASFIALGFGIVTFTLAQVMKGDAPRAYLLAPYDGRLTAGLAAQLGSGEADDRHRRQADALARTALRQDPAAVAAAGVVGLNAQVRGDLAGARRAFAYAETLSRRDSITQMWAIEDAVARGDVSGAMQHYDIALRVNPKLGGLLFPVLAAASSVPAVQSELVRTLAARPLWADSFVNFAAVGNGTDPRAIAVLFQRLGRSGMTLPEAALAALTQTLYENGRVDQAWAFYASFRRGVSRDQSRDPRFAARLDAPTPFDWVINRDNGVVGAIEGGGFEFSAPSGIGGAMLRQIQLLPNGTYRISGHSVDIGRADGARPYVMFACLNGRELG